jgi:signal transduction histidine kinase
MPDALSPWEQGEDQQQRYIRLLELRCELLQREVEHLRQRATEQAVERSSVHLPALHELLPLSSPEELLQRACAILQRLTAAPSAYAVRLLPDGSLEVFPEEALAHARLVVEEGIMDWVSARGIPAVLPDLFSSGASSLLIVALGQPGKPSGALVARGISPNLSGETFQGELLSLGTLVSVLLDNVESARLTQALQEQLHQLRRQLQHSEALATLGKITGIVLHELSNPLQALYSHAELIEAGVGNPREHARLLLHELTRLRQLVSELRQLLSRSSVFPERVPVDLVQLLQRTLRLLHPQFQRDGVRIHFEADLPHAVVLSSGGQLEQLFLNLFLNARDAMPQGGTLHIRLRSEGSDILVECADTGEGIPAELLDHIFEPFFTTKAHGSGLGLSIARDIVQQHGGSITVSSTPGVGTLVTVRLPAAQTVGQTSPPPCESSSLPSSAASS